VQPNISILAHPRVRAMGEALWWLALAAMVCLMAILAMQGQMIEVRVGLEAAAQLDASGYEIGAALTRMSTLPGLGVPGLGR
jgi:flagellar biosynthesis protein FliR